ncbi:MAG: hypothetical protein APF82_10920 [Sphingomonadales bacterium BRH_c42]|nr:MAG: hypothetical protein APF82_10920 [Sphingomonadales bacterium BRH_c42]
MILLYAEGNKMAVATLQTWVEYRNASEFKSKVLKPLHKKALIHFDESGGTVQILPTGQAFVEKSGLLATT